MYASKLGGSGGMLPPPPQNILFSEVDSNAILESNFIVLKILLTK